MKSKYAQRQCANETLKCSSPIRDCDQHSPRPRSTTILEQAAAEAGRVSTVASRVTRGSGGTSRERLDGSSHSGKNVGASHKARRGNAAGVRDHSLGAMAVAVALAVMMTIVHAVAVVVAAVLAHSLALTVVVAIAVGRALAVVVALAVLVTVALAVAVAAVLILTLAVRGNIGGRAALEESVSSHDDYS